MNIVILGTGRAGTAFAGALRLVGHEVALRSHLDVAVAADVDLVLLCVPDDAIADVAAALVVGAGTVVAHCAGSRTLAELGAVTRPASLHPLVALSDPLVGAARLVGATYCVAGDALVTAVATSLRGRVITLPDDLRARYHATACVAANHLVTLMAQVQRLAELSGLSLGDFVGLARDALDDVERLGPLAALTGPAARGDLATIDRHLSTLPESERALYVALANGALALGEQRRAASAP
jgi:predicted short-subunit dehydrogenase-like oxidoreductase (DUF2520 family)